MEISAIKSLTDLLETYPPAVQKRAIEQFREYLEDVTDDLRWETSFDRTAPRLEDFARTVKQQISNGEAEEMDFGRL